MCVWRLALTICDFQIEPNKEPNKSYLLSFLVIPQTFIKQLQGNGSCVVCVDVNTNESQSPPWKNIIT